MLVSQKEVNNCDITSENTYKYPSVIGFSPSDNTTGVLSS